MTKIEIDLNDILGDEYGTESLQESVRRQVVDKVTSLVSETTAKRINDEIAKVMDEEIRKAVQIQMPAIVNDLVSQEYTPLDRYGSKGQPTTFRAELVKAVLEQMVYKKTQYSSDENVFTKAVNSIVNEKVNEFKKDFLEKINSNFVADTMKYALDTLRNKLDIPF